MKVICNFTNCAFNKKGKCKIKKKTGWDLVIGQDGVCYHKVDISKLPKFEPSRTCMVSEFTNLTFGPAEEVKNESFD